MAESQPPVSSNTTLPSPKRKSSSTESNEKPHRPTKRRASKACQCCRSRKVRCNVVEHGPPCTNCRLDEVECVVTESKRKRRSLPKLEEEGSAFSATSHLHNARNRASRGVLDGIPSLHDLASRPSTQRSSFGEHVPHSLYRTHSDKLGSGEPVERPRISASNSAPDVGRSWDAIPNDRSTPSLAQRNTHGQNIPKYLKPIPTRMGAEEVEYLQKKGAFVIPDVWLRDELCRAYVEFVHPYMPLINVHESLHTMQKGDGSHGKISLLLFQGMMFAGSAFVGLDSLKKAGFHTRKDARKVFFQRVRHLYDFDYEIDRFSQVQTLLLMTSWYETSDDKKDAWHWMGIAIATSYTIGLHRNPALSNMDPAQQRLWKRVWWACVIRDRLIALGARRPIRIKPEDCDVPMLSLADFDFGVLSDDVESVPLDCQVVRDVPTQTSLAVMCIEKAKLCLCISDVLSSQYSIQKSSNATSGLDMRSVAVLSPKPFDPESSTIKSCHDALESWLNQLPADLHPSAGASPNESVTRGEAPLVVQRAILQLIYYATLSALHRPQVLHTMPSSCSPSNDEIGDLSRESLRHAALETTRTAKTLLDLDLVQYLPTTGVSVLQPAIISHLLDIKSTDEEIRRTALQGFCQCIQVLEKLRDCYTAADHSIALVEAAIRRADIKIPVQVSTPSDSSSSCDSYTEKKAESAGDLVDAGRRENLVPLPTTNLQTATPPPEAKIGNSSMDLESQPLMGSLTLPTDFDIARKLEVFLASTPLESEPQSVPGVDYLTCVPVGHYTYDADFDAFVDFSGADNAMGMDVDMDVDDANDDSIYESNDDISNEDDGSGDADRQEQHARDQQMKDDHQMLDQQFSSPHEEHDLGLYSQYATPNPATMFFNESGGMGSPGAEFDRAVKTETTGADHGSSPVMSLAAPS